MALSIKTEEADRLARELSRLTGESMTDAVTTSLRERLARERQLREARNALPKLLKVAAARLRKNYDMRAVTKAEWDSAWGDST